MLRVISITTLGLGLVLLSPEPGWTRDDTRSSNESSPGPLVPIVQMPEEDSMQSGSNEAPTPRIGAASDAAPTAGAEQRGDVLEGRGPIPVPRFATAPPSEGTHSAADTTDALGQTSSVDAAPPKVVTRQGLNPEPPLSRAEIARPLFENSHRSASRASGAEFGPASELDPRQMLFEPGEPMPRAPEDEIEVPEGRILIFGNNGPSEIRGMAGQDRTERIYGRLRRVMEMGRNPR